MKQYKLVVSYDGTDYYGWQEQKNRPSIVSTMQTAFYRVFNEHIKLIGASRTDAGVHAIGQVATFKTRLNINKDKILFAWNNALPSAIRMTALEDTYENFHPYRTSTIKTYWYHFFIQSPLPFAMRYGWYIAHSIDIEKLKQALHTVRGTHDFISFCTQPLDNKESTVRTILAIDVEYISLFNCYRIAVRGTGFLRHMIRRIVGAGVFIAMKEHMAVSYMQEILQQRDPNNVLPTAPARGLLLYEVQYLSVENGVK